MPWDRQSVLERCAVSAATAWGFYLMARFVNHRWHMASLEQQIKETQALLDHEREKRKADRVGRIRAEQELRSAKVELQQLQLEWRQQQLQQLQELLREEQAAAQEEEQEEEEEEVAEVGTSSAAAGAGGSGRTEAEEAGGAASAVTEGAQQQQEQPQQPKQAAGVAAAGAGGEAKRAAVAATAALAAAGAAMSAFPFRPIGHLQSVFSERNGTPRQPQLVPAARSRLVLCRDVPPACLEGLAQYSHCWVLYVFHANTDLAKYLSPDRSGLKAKIHVPRLNGGRMGVLATRSPHRPSPIGLSTAQIIAVEGNTLVLGGVDIVDGSPVLDIKPYVPFCDCLTAASAPAWVQAEAEDEPLAVGQVVVGEAARAALVRAWQARKAHSMYGSAEEYLDLVRQVLSRDIRSVHQRLHVKPTSAAASSSSSSSTPAAAAVPPHAGATFAHAAPPPPPQAAGGSSKGGAGGGEGPGQYHVVLENIYISYDISPTGVVELYDAWVDPITAR